MSDTKQLCGVAQAPVTKLVTQDSNDLFWLTLLDKGIIDHNVLLPRQTVEVGVAVSTPLAAIDDVQLLEGEAQLLCQVLDASLEFTGFQGRELVEQRQDHDRVDGDSEDLDKDTKEPEVVEERVARLLDDLEHSTDDRATQDDTQQLTLKHVRHPELDCLLVETELLLENEGVVVRYGKRQEGGDYIEGEEEQ